MKKKIIGLSLAALTVLFITGCSETKPEIQKKNTDQVNDQKTEVQEKGIGVTTDGDVKIIIEGFEE